MRVFFLRIKEVNMKKFFLLVLFFVLTASAAYASARGPDPCSGDIERFCEGVDPAKNNAVLDCLEKNEDKLSAECKADEARMGGGRTEARERKAHIAMFRKACADEVSKFCKDAKGHDEALKCLDGHKDRLSGACIAGIKEMKEE